MYLYMGDAIKINFLNFSGGNIVSKYYVFSEHITDINQIFDKKYRFFNFLKKRIFFLVFALSLIKTLSSKR